MYAMSVITALTAQNTTGVSGVQEISPDFVAKQLDCIFYRHPPDSVKIGMLSGEGTIRAVAAKLRQYGAKNVVVDPVMVSTSGTSLLSEAGRRALWEELLPLSTLVTPNLPETQVFSGQPVETEGGHAPGRPGNLPSLPLRGPHQGRPFGWGTPQTFCMRRGKRCGSDPANFQSQHPRHRLHPLFRHRLRSGSRLQFGGERPAGQGLPHRRTVRRIGLGPWPGAFGSYVSDTAGG